MSQLSLAQLTDDEQRDRHQLERQVERAFYSAGIALLELRDRRLYRSTHSSFEAYCRDRFGMKRRHPYRLIDAAKVVSNILKVCPIGTHHNGKIQQDPIIPTSERQARPLTKLTPKEQIIAWQKAIEIANGKVPSGKIVSQIVSSMCPNQIRYKVGQRIKIKASHLLGGYSGIIKQVNKGEIVTVSLDNGKTIVINQEYLELELISDIKELPPQGVAYSPGIGLEYNVRLSQETWDELNAYATEVGAASLDGAIARLLLEAKQN